MISLETGLRLAVVGQEIILTAVFLFARGSRSARVGGSVLTIGVAGYLLNSDPLLRAQLSAVLPMIILLSILVPYGLWLFARAVFEAPWPPRWIVGLFAGTGLAMWIIWVRVDDFGDAWAHRADIVMHLLSLAIVAHSLWITWRGRADDLIDERRTFRIWFVVLIAGQTTAVLLFELATGFGPESPLRSGSWMTMLNVAIIAALTLGFAIAMLRLRGDFFPAAHPGAARVARTESGIPAADEVLRRKLLAAMESGSYRETGLTIRSLAERLDYPEHQLRRVINGHLGYRNFSAFLNGYRIAEAKNRLADPERARQPVLTIALDLGYGSLGPFNRAFKAGTGMTPTGYRRSKLGAQPADSGKS